MPEELTPGEKPPEELTPGEKPPELPADVTPAEPKPKSETPTVESLATDLAEAKAALKRANAESAQRRKKLSAFEKAEEERKVAQLSETEKAQKAAQDWESKFDQLSSELDTARMRAKFYDEVDVQKLAFVNAQAKRDAFALSDLSGVAMDDDELTGMDAAVKALVKSHPHLFGTAQTAVDINATTTGGGKGKATEDQMIEFAARMGVDVKHLDPALVAQAMQ